MDRLKKSADPAREDPLSSHRDQVMYAISLVAVVFLFPFALNDLVHGHATLGAAILGIVLMLAVDANAIRRRRPAPVPYALLLAPITISILIALRLQGIYGALWCYPATLFFYFVLSRRVANICVFILLVAVTLMAYRYIGPALTVRFIVSLTMTLVIINIILNVITDLHRRLFDQAIKDPLTDAFNRRYMEARLREAVGANRRRGTPASILLIDIDHFKDVNDRFGHEVGDKVLRSMVTLIGGRLRKTDLLFRVGGEEFLVLLLDTREEEAAALAEQLRLSIAAAPLVQGHTVCVSIGVSELREDEARHAWIKSADNALYAAKHGGRNRVVRRLGEPASAAPGARHDPSVPA